jgi:hypothetical protein
MEPYQWAADGFNSATFSDIDSRAGSTLCRKQARSPEVVLRKLSAEELAAIVQLAAVPMSDREIAQHQIVMSGAGTQRLVLGQPLPVIHQVLFL